MLHVIGSAQQEVGYSGLFKKRMLWNLIYSSEDYHPIATKLGEHYLKTLGTQNCQDIFDISNGFARGEAMNLWRKMRDRKHLIHPHTLSDFDQTSGFCSLYDAERIDVTIRSQSYSATNWQQEVCHFQMLWIQHLIFNRFASNFIRIMSKHGRCKNCEGNIDIYNTVAMATFSNLKICFWWFEADNMF